MSVSKHVYILSLSALCFLPACDWFGQQQQDSITSDQMSESEFKQTLESAAMEVMTDGISVIDEQELTGDVLITMNGKPIVTTDSLASERDKIIEANPQLKQMIALMDMNELNRNLAEGLLNQAVLDAYVAEGGIDKNPAYQKELKEGYKAVERMVNTKFFTQGFDINVSDNDAREFYDKNKTSIPELIMAREGVTAQGIAFDSEAEARNFVSKMSGTDLKASADAQGVSDKIQDFMTVSEQSYGIDKDLRSKILAVSTFPSVHVLSIESGKTWVILATGKEDAQYRPFDQVKDGLKDYLEKDQRAKLYEEEIKVLKERYNIQIKPGFLNDPEQQMAQEDIIEAVSAEFDDAVNTVAQMDYADDVQMV